jgi:leucine-rich repeat-containing protein 49
VEEAARVPSIGAKARINAVNRSISLDYDETDQKKMTTSDHGSNEMRTSLRVKLTQTAQGTRSPLKNRIGNHHGEYYSPGQQKKTSNHNTVMNTSNGFQNSAIKTDKPADIQKLLGEEEDERFRYLLKYGIVRKLDNNAAIFAELPQIPGVWVYYRKQSEKNERHEKLILDNKDLNHLPLLEGEEKLKLLSLKHNKIKSIENLVSLPNIIYLDLYDNQINEIENLSTATTLRVLMIAKNHISKIKNLQFLTKLDVLDLHSNFITKIEGLRRLEDLRILNLANNSISKIEDLEHLTKLSELNLKLNHVEDLEGLAKLKNLSKLYLSNNKIFSIKTLKNLKNLPKLQELTLDENPVCANTTIYYRCIYDVCPWIRNLDHKAFEVIKIEIASMIAFPETSSIAIAGQNFQNPKAKRTELPAIVKNAPTEPNTVSTTVNSNNLKSKLSLEKKNSHLSTKESEDTPTVIKSQHHYESKGKDHGEKPDPSKETTLTPEEVISIIAEQFRNEVERIERLKTNGINNKKELYKDSLLEGGHAEMESNTILYLYGNSYEIVLQNKQFQENVDTIYLEYVLYDMIIQSKYLAILKQFKKLTKLVLKNNNIGTFLQIARLEALPHLKQLIVLSNPICSSSMLKEFIVYRFPDLNEFNEQKLEDVDKNGAKLNFQEFDNILTVPSKILGTDSTKLSVQEKSQINSKLLEDISEQLVKKLYKDSHREIELKKVFENLWIDRMIHP